MKLRKSLAIAFTLMLATGVGTVALANQAKASSEDVNFQNTQDNSTEQINEVIEPGQSCFPPRC